MDIDVDIPRQRAEHNRLILAHLNTPYVEGSAEPSVPLGSAPQSDLNVRQLPLSPIVQLTQETIRMLEAYDKHAVETRAYYVGALERMRARNGGVVDAAKDPRRRSSGGRGG